MLTTLTKLYLTICQGHTWEPKSRIVLLFFFGGEGERGVKLSLNIHGHDLAHIIEQLTSRLKTDSSTHLNKRSRQHHMSLNSWFDLHCPKKCSTVVFKNNTCGCVSWFLSKVFLYTGADWLCSYVSQRVARHQLTHFTNCNNFNGPPPPPPF